MKKALPKNIWHFNSRLFESIQAIFLRKNERVVSHTKDEAQNIALKKIYYDFIKNKTSEREMICSMVLLKYVEEPSDFYLLMPSLVK